MSAETADERTNTRKETQIGASRERTRRAAVSFAAELWLNDPTKSGDFIDFMDEWLFCHPTFTLDEINTVKPYIPFTDEERQAGRAWCMKYDGYVRNRLTKRYCGPVGIILHCARK